MILPPLCAVTEDLHCASAFYASFFLYGRARSSLLRAASSSCGEPGLFLAALLGLLFAVGSPAAGHRLCSAGSVVEAP